MLLLTSFYVLAFAFLIITCYSKKYEKYHIYAKTLNSIGFIAIATWAYFKSGSIYYFTMLPGLLLCLCGDVLLAFEDKDGKKTFFLGGLFSFLMGHIFFVWSFSIRTPLVWHDLLIPVIVVLITYLLTKMKHMNVGKMKKYVLVYSFFIALLFSKGIGLAFLSNALISGFLILAGSALFFISDGIILFMYFYEKKHYIVRFLNLLTYYLGLYFIALSLLY